MSGAHAEASAPVDVARLAPATGAKLVRMGGALAAVGILMSAAAGFVDTKRFAYAWLTGVEYVLTMGLGALLFVLIQHVTKAGWSVAARRQAEWVAGVLPLCFLLFVPVAVLFAPTLFHEWWVPKHEDAVVMGKQAWLNPKFFYVRVVVYFAIWTGLSRYFRGRSLAQDESGDKNETARMQKWSAPAILLTALSLTFAHFDWVMSLDPHWYSTIFGVYIFAGGMVSFLGALALMTLALQKSHFKRISTVEHRHDVGKLLFGFTVFWAYIGFSQFFLIWYANIPEETLFYWHRWHGGWGWVSASLPIMHFAVPFIVLLSRTAKRTPALLATGAVILLVMHYVDMFWLVMPNYDHESLHFGWIEVAGLLGPLGVLAFWVASRAASQPLYPLRDPRISESMRNDNP